MTSSAKKKVSDFFLSFPQKTYAKGSLFILPNTPITSVFYIEKGIARSYLISAKGNEITVNFFGKDAFIPIGLAINSAESLYYYEAFSDIVVRVAPAQKTVHFLSENSLVMYELLQRVYRGIEGILLNREYLIEGTALAKLAYVLITIAKRFGQVQHDSSILIPFDLDEIRIASIAGIARETASRELHKLEESHIISYIKKQLTIHNVLFLENALQTVIQ